MENGPETHRRGNARGGRLGGLIRYLGLTARDAHNTWSFILEAFEIVAIATLILTIILFAGCKAPWSKKYIEPLLGSHWSGYALPLRCLLFGLFSTLLSLASCLIAGAISRILYTTRYVFYLAGTVTIVIFFIAPTVSLTSLFITLVDPKIPWKIGCIIAAIPTLALLPCCFYFMEQLLPELLPLIRHIFGIRPKPRAEETGGGPADSGETGDDPAGQSAPDPTRGMSPKELDRHYARILGLQGKNTFEQVKARYRELAAQYHPDKVQHLGDKLKAAAELEMKQINQAYEHFKREYGPHTNAGDDDD